ncbi:MAG: hypothetical protein NVSMB57_07470 [Actinomycetota bacterium]
MARQRAGVVAALLLAAWILVPASGASAAIRYGGAIAASNPAALAVDGARSRLYIGERSGDLIIAGSGSMTESARVPVGCCIASIAVSSETDRVLVAGSSLYVIDPVKASITNTISFGGDELGSITVDTPPTHAYVVLPARGQVAVVDLATSTITHRFNISVHRLGSIRWFNGGRLFVSERDASVVHAIDEHTGAEAAAINVYLPVFLDVDLAAGVLYAASAGGAIDMIDAVTFVHFRTLDSGATPAAIAVNPANGRVWVADSSDSHIRVLRSADGAILDRYPLAASQSAVTLDASTGRAYAAVPALVASDGKVVSLAEAPGLVSIQTPLPNGFMGASSRVMTGGAPPGATVSIRENGVLMGTVVANDESHWSISLPWAEGAHTVIASAPEEASSPPRTFSVDLTPPVPALVSRTQPNAAGWNNSVVFLRWTCTDSMSGATAAQIDTVLAAQGKDLSASVTCTDKAGNSATMTVPGFNIDWTPPVLVVRRTPPANSAGWHRSATVKIHLECVDRLSGLAGDYAPVDATITGETSGKTTSIRCADVAGNVRLAQEITRIDVHPPEATVDDTKLAVGSFVVVGSPFPITGSAFDSLSKPFSVEVALTDGVGRRTTVMGQCDRDCGASTMRWRAVPPDGMAGGLYSVSARSTDWAGNRGAWSAPQSIFVAGVPDLSALPLG